MKPWPQVTEYSDFTVYATDNGLQVEGPVPDIVGVYRELLADMSTDLGDFYPRDGLLRILDMWWRQIGVDGAAVLVFERTTAPAEVPA